MGKERKRTKEYILVLPPLLRRDVVPSRARLGQRLEVDSTFTNKKSAINPTKLKWDNRRVGRKKKEKERDERRALATGRVLGVAARLGVVGAFVLLLLFARRLNKEIIRQIRRNG